MFQNKTELRTVEFAIIEVLQESDSFKNTLEEIKQKIMKKDKINELNLSDKSLEKVFLNLFSCDLILDSNGNQVSNPTDALDIVKQLKDSYEVFVYLNPKFSDLTWAAFDNSLSDDTMLNEPSSLHRIAHKHLYGTK